MFTKNSRVRTPDRWPRYGTVIGQGLQRGRGVVYVLWDDEVRDTRLPEGLVLMGGVP